MIRFDGIYTAQLDDDVQRCQQYIRFYEDDRVIAVSSEGSPADVAKWFQWDHPTISRGTYHVVQSRLSFSSMCESGRVDYDGTINENDLELRTFSQINGFSAMRLYAFVPFASIAPN